MSLLSDLADVFTQMRTELAEAPISTSGETVRRLAGLIIQGQTLVTELEEKDEHDA